MPPRITDEQRLAIRRGLADGKTTAAVAKAVGVSVRQVAAVAAHMTMGSYGKERPAPSSESRNSAVDVRRRKAPPTSPNSESGVEARRGVVLGFDLETLGAVRWDPLPSTGLANPHVLIVGGSGFGKTYAIASIVAELAHDGLPSIIFDYAQGFAPSSLPPGFAEHVTVHEVDASTEGIDVNPLQLFAGDVLGPVNVAQRVADTFKRVFPQLGIQQHAFLRDAIIDLLAKSGVHATDPTSWTRSPPPFQLLHDYLVRLGDSATGPTARIHQSLAAHVSTLFVYNTLRPGGRRMDWSSLLSKQRAITILQLRGLEHSLSKIVTEFLLWNLIGFVEHRGPSPMSTFVVLDEAHRLSFDEGSPVERLLREGRKFGLGLMLASQQPTDFSPVAFANTATKLVFQVDDDRNYVSRQISRKTTTHSLRDIDQIITRIPRGVAYAILGNEGVVLKVESFDARVRRWTDGKSSKGRQRV